VILDAACITRFVWPMPDNLCALRTTFGFTFIYVIKESAGVVVGGIKSGASCARDSIQGAYI